MKRGTQWIMNNKGTINELAGDTGNVVQAGSVIGDIIFAGRRHVAPAQLRPSSPHFTNRESQLTELGRSLQASEVGPRLVLITGEGGAGKTALALRWANRTRDRFKHGQFGVDFRGFSRDASGPLEARTALERLLRALEVPPAYMSSDPDEMAARWRSETAGRRVLILADNVAFADQVRPLLPGPGPSAVVITSRRPLHELAIDGARAIHVGPLDESSCRALLDSIAGTHRRHDEPHAVQALISAGQLPLEICTLAARLAAHPTRSTARLLNSPLERRAEPGSKAIWPTRR
jgi:hypothetical protein